MKRKNYQRGTDSVPAKLTPREAVLNRNAAELLGRHNIAALNAHGNMLAYRGVDLPSDPTPGPSTENMLGYQMGTYDVGDDRGDLMRDADSSFYGGTTPPPSPTPTPIGRGYAYGTEDVRRRRGNAADRYSGIIQRSGAGNAGYGIGNGALSPDQNPAYQAAISKGRPSRSGYTMIQTPSGGSMAVPVGQTRKYTDLLFKGNPTADTGFQRPNPQEAYALGNTGAIPTGNSPYARSFRLGSNIEGPVQQPQSSFGYQVGNVLKNTAPYALGLATNAASRVAGFFGGGNAPSIIPSANAGAPSPSPTPYQTPQPIQATPTPTPTIPPEDLPGYQFGTANVMPRRYSDYY